MFFTLEITGTYNNNNKYLAWARLLERLKCVLKFVIKIIAVLKYALNNKFYTILSMEPCDCNILYSCGNCLTAIKN